MKRINDSENVGGLLKSRGNVRREEIKKDTYAPIISTVTLLHLLVFHPILLPFHSLPILPLLCTFSKFTSISITVFTCFLFCSSTSPSLSPLISSHFILISFFLSSFSYFLRLLLSSSSHMPNKLYSLILKTRSSSCLPFSPRNLFLLCLLEHL